MIACAQHFVSDSKVKWLPVVLSMLLLGDTWYPYLRVLHGGKHLTPRKLRLMKFAEFLLANLYQQPKVGYVEIGRDVKPFVLTSRAGDPPPDVQDSLLKSAANGVGSALHVPTSSADERLTGEVTVAKGPVDKNSNYGPKDFRKHGDEAHVASTNGDARDHALDGKGKHSKDREDIVDKSRDKDRDRASDRDHDRARVFYLREGTGEGKGPG